MSDSAFNHDFQNPGLELVHLLLKTIVSAPDHGEIRNGLKHCCKKACPDWDHAHLLMQVQDICAAAGEKVGRVNAPRMARDIHITNLQGVRTLFLRTGDRDKWIDFQGAVNAGHFIQSLILIDHFIGRDAVPEAQWQEFARSTASSADDFIRRVREEADLPAELKELVIAQLDFVSSSLRRYDSFGLSDFQESVALSYGRLTMVLQKRPDKQTWKLVDEIVQWEAGLHTFSASLVGGRGLLTFESVKVLQGPKAA